MNWQRAVPGPALSVHPPGAASLDEAHAAIEQWEHYSGKQLDSAQRLAVEQMMVESASGRWAARTTGRAESRQNGKGDEIEVVEAWDLTQRGAAIVHTCHEIPTAKSAHERLVAHLEGHRDLRRKIKGQPTYANGNQTIPMLNGGIVVYRTRTSGGGRGLDDISRLVVDEAQHAQPEQLASSTPILAANPNPQMNFIGSAGIAERSDWWWSLRKRALDVIFGGAEAGEFSWLEHSAEVVELNRDGKVLSTHPDVEDREAWARANPALGVRIDEEFLVEQLRSVLGPDLFAREHLGVWDPYPGQDGGFLPFDTWMELEVEAPESMRSVCYGLSVAADGASAAFASAARLPSGDLYVDVVEAGEGTDWIVRYAVDLQGRRREPIRVNPAAVEGSFIRALTDAGVEVVEVSAREYQQSCGEVLDQVKNRTLRHLRNSRLDRAVQSAQRREVGKEGAWVWEDPPSGVDLSPLRAATLALAGVTSRRRQPRIHTYDPNWKPEEATT